jgi:hypothetical protein
MKEVWKFILEYTWEVNSFIMPKGAKIVHVHEQDGKVCLWAEVEPRLAETRSFLIAGMGQKIDDAAVYIGTAHIGPLVWHVYEVKP